MKAFTAFQDFEPKTMVWVNDVPLSTRPIRRVDDPLQTQGVYTVKTSSEKWDEAWAGAMRDHLGGLKAVIADSPVYEGIDRSSHAVWKDNRSTWFDEYEPLTPESFADSLPLGWRKMTHMHAYQHAPSGTIVPAIEIYEAGCQVYDYLESHVDWDETEWLPMGDCRA